MNALSIPQMPHLPLTNREMEVARLLSWGYTDKETASILNISWHTVRTHHDNINTKTKIRNLADLTRWYFQTINKASLGQRPSFKRVAGVCVVLLMVGFSEFIHADFIRVKTNVSVVKVNRVKRKTYNA